MKRFVIIAVIVAGVSFIFVNRSTNNVCKTFEDYYSNRDFNENCYYNPDGDLTVPEIITRQGYPVENHTVTTNDGYILTLFRIPHGKNSNKKSQKRRPILLQHGNSINSATYINIGTKSLGFILADAGFDVWLGNFRGTIYGSNHSVFSSDDPRFWNFSLHEHGIYDLPAHVDYIYDLTKEKITYVGYSMGGTVAYVYGTVFPEIAEEKVKIFIGLAPAIFIDNTSLSSTFLSKFWFIFEPILQPILGGAISPKGVLPTFLQKYICLPYPFQMKMCELPDMINMGFDYEQADPETLPTTVQKNADRTSLKTLNHFFQMVRTGQFRLFDYGKKNEGIYGSSTPPLYDLSKIKVPSYIIGAENDVLISLDGLKKLKNVLPEDMSPYDVYVIKYKRFNHADFIVAKDVVNLLYDHLVEFISKL